MSNYTWVPFYTELANTLLAYRDNRNDMISKVVAAYDQAKIKMPKMDSTDIPVDMDPFTVFGLFSKSMKDANRIALCSALKTLFDIKAAAPSGFDGVPVLNPLNATFYRFTDDPDRGEKDIDNLWDCFTYAIAFADNPCTDTEVDFVVSYNTVKDLKGNRWKLTMALYWIRPYFFLSLDSRNRWFLTSPGKIGKEFTNTLESLKDIPAARDYLDICSDCIDLIKSNTDYENIVDLSFAAWNVSEAENQKQKEEAAQPAESIGSALADQDVRTVHYWLYAPGNNAAYWDTFYQEGILALGWGETGDARKYPSREALKEKLRQEWNSPDSPAKYPSLAIWQLLHEMKNGDIVFVKQGRHKIIGRGVVTSDYEFVDDYPIEDYKHQRRVKWTHNGEWEYPKDNAPLKTLTDMTEYTGTIEAIINYFADDAADDISADVIDESEVQYPPYTSDDFLSEVYMSADEYDTLVGLLRSKKNVILQGAPGVGKTFTAKRLAYSMMSVKDQDRVAMVQFHQSYSYEDFIMGFRPTATGFELKKGAFYNFCKKAQDDPDNEYFFIIDEINRGNLSKIFGELFMLIENDKRGIGMQLLYADETFSVPKNVMIIGMMNTADRSLAMMDYALRRRFAFFEMVPGFETDGFRLYQENLDNEKFDQLIACVEGLNRVIADDESLGDGFRIGHSYFSNLDQKKLDDQALMGIVRFELIPLLREYWFDEPQKVKEWTAKLESAAK